MVFNPPPESRADLLRRERALRRVYGKREVPSWVRKIPWVVFPIYGLMRLHDPDYEKHYQQWEDQDHRAGD